MDIKLGKIIISIEINKANSDKQTIKEATNLLITQNKLAALKRIKEYYDIGLKECKEILDGVVTSDGTGYYFTIKNPKFIRKYLKKELEKFPKKL